MSTDSHPGRQALLPCTCALHPLNRRQVPPPAPPGPRGPLLLPGAPASGRCSRAGRTRQRGRDFGWGAGALRFPPPHPSRAQPEGSPPLGRSEDELQR